jgi:LuxR family maltose regulon positive regulatory protein
VPDLVQSKLRRPVTRPGTLRRSPLIATLALNNSRPIVSVAAPAGYGKTTLLSQWAERNGKAFAWVSVDDKDNDPKVLLTYIAAALDAIEPVGGRVFDALASPVSSVPGSVVPRLGAASCSMRQENPSCTRRAEGIRTILLAPTSSSLISGGCGSLSGVPAGGMPS